MRILDEVQTAAQLDALDAARVVPQGTLEESLEVIDRFSQKAMRILLNRISDQIPSQILKLFQTTIIAYEHDQPLLRQRVSALLQRQDAASAARLTDDICTAGARVLALRATLRQTVTPPPPPPEPEPKPEEEVDATEKRFSLLELD